MDEIWGILAVAVLTLVIPLCGVTVLWIHRALMSRRRSIWMRPRYVRAFSLVVSMAGLLASGLVIGRTAETMSADGLGVAAILASSVTLSLTMFIQFGAYVVWKAAGRIPKRDEAHGEFDRAMESLSLCGWVFVFMPLAFFGPPILILVLGPLFVGIVVVVAVASYHRARQGRLLWLLAITVESGRPLSDELQAHAASTRGATARRIQRLAGRISDGVPLVDALAEFPGLIPRSALMAAHVGYESNTLATSLRDAAVRHTNGMLRSGSASSLSWFFVYFWVVVSVTILVLAFKMFFIVPKIQMIFEQFDVELPEVSIFVFNAASMVESNVFLFGPLVSLPTLGLIALGVSFFTGWGNVSLPKVAGWLPRLESPTVFRCLATVVEAGGQLPNGIRLIAESHPDARFRRLVDRLSKSVESGKDCWESMVNEKLLTKRERTLLDAAQRTGNLPWALGRLAQSIESHREHRLLTMFEVVRPLCVLALGGCVLLVSIAFFLPLVHLIGSFFNESAMQ